MLQLKYMGHILLQKRAMQCRFFFIVARQQCQNITDISNVELIYLEACFLLVHIMIIMAGEDV